MFDVAVERRRVPAGAGRLPPLPGAPQAHQAHALPQRRAAADLQVSISETEVKYSQVRLMDHRLMVQFC